MGYDFPLFPIADNPEYLQMMKRSLCPLLIPLISMCVVSPTFVSAEVVTCADHSIVASAVRTPGDIQAFVQCAYEYVQEEGFSEARRAFNEDERWRHGPIYIFVSEVTPMTEMARAFVFPPDPSGEGEPWGLLIDVYGNDIIREVIRVVDSVGEGWIYYSITNPATGRDEPKNSYVKSIDWDGTPAAIGAGIYRRDIPGTCNSEEVNAMLLDSDPSNERLKEFVRCAAMELEMKGYFAIDTLTTEPRWRSDSIYLFALDTDGYTLFSGEPYSQQILSLISTLLGDTQFSGDPNSQGSGIPELDNKLVEELFSLFSILLGDTQFGGDPNGQGSGIPELDNIPVEELFSLISILLGDPNGHGSGVPELNNMPEEELLSLISTLLGDTQFSVDLYSQESIVSELEGTVEDHEVVSVADAFGETFLYYSRRNPSTEMMQQKVTFVKRTVSFGLPILIGAGYYLEEGP